MTPDSLISPFNLTYNQVDARADELVETLLGRIKTNLERIEHTTTGDDSPLTNCWEEICVQQQSEEFYYWAVFEMTIEGVIEGYVDELSHSDQLLLSFSAFNALNSGDEPDYDCVHTEEVYLFLYGKVLELASDDTNPRIEAYLNPRPYDDVANENMAYNPDEFLLLRIDPTKRNDFLAALNLYGFVRNITIDDDALPVLAELLDNLDVPENE